jgi:hypothetical protein
MKVTSFTPEPTFTPKSITITVESKEEMDALYELSRLDQSIPNLIHNHLGTRDAVKDKILKEFLHSVYMFSNPTARYDPTK